MRLHAAAEHGAETTAQEYITHHLSYLTFGQHPDGHWGFAHTMEEAAEMGFWQLTSILHVDVYALGVYCTVVFKFGIGKKPPLSSNGVQNFVESIFEFVDERVSEGFNRA